MGLFQGEKKPKREKQVKEEANLPELLASSSTEFDSEGPAAEEAVGEPVPEAPKTPDPSKLSEMEQNEEQEEVVSDTDNAKKSGFQALWLVS